jgi:hypothetical protein
VEQEAAGRSSRRRGAPGAGGPHGRARGRRGKLRHGPLLFVLEPAAAPAPAGKLVVVTREVVVAAAAVAPNPGIGAATRRRHEREGGGRIYRRWRASRQQQCRRGEASGRPPRPRPPAVVRSCSELAQGTSILPERRPPELETSLLDGSSAALVLPHSVLLPKSAAEQGRGRAPSIHRRRGGAPHVRSGGGRGSSCLLGGGGGARPCPSQIGACCPPPPGGHRQGWGGSRG